MGLGRHLNFCINVELFNDEYLFELKCTILGLKDNPSFPWWLSKARNFFLFPIYHLSVKLITSEDKPLGHIFVNIIFFFNITIIQLLKASKN